MNDHVPVGYNGIGKLYRFIFVKPISIYFLFNGSIIFFLSFKVWFTGLIIAVVDFVLNKYSFDSDYKDQFLLYLR